MKLFKPVGLDELRLMYDANMRSFPSHVDHQPVFYPAPNLDYAVKIAREILGVPITNTTLLGSLVKASELVKKESFIPPLKERFGRIAEKNISAFERAYQETVLIQ